MGIILFLITQYNGIDPFAQQFLTQYFKNTIISLISLRIAFFIERFIFDKIEKKIPCPYNQFCSVSCGQIFDTTFYTVLIFYNKSIIHMMQIFGFSYSIKLVCIIIYSYFLKHD